MSSDTQFCAWHLVMDCSLLVGLHKEWLVVGVTVTFCPHCGVGHTVSTVVIYCHQSTVHCSTLKMHMVNIICLLTQISHLQWIYLIMVGIFRFDIDM